MVALPSQRMYVNQAAFKFPFPGPENPDPCRTKAQGGRPHQGHHPLRGRQGRARPTAQPETAGLPPYPCSVLQDFPNAVPATVAEWGRRYQEDRAAGTAELLTLLARSGGLDFSVDPGGLEDADCEEEIAKEIERTAQEASRGTPHPAVLRLLTWSAAAGQGAGPVPRQGRPQALPNDTVRVSQWG